MAIARTRAQRVARSGAKPREVTKAVDWPDGVKLADVTVELVCEEWDEAANYHHAILSEFASKASTQSRAEWFVGFAVRGGREVGIEEFALELGALIFGSPAHLVETFADAVRPSERFPHIAAALQAVRGRLCLARGEPIVTSDLAMLASLDASRVRQLLRAGTFWAMKQHGTHIVEARDAKQWLADRGVAGFAPEEATDGM